MFIPSNLVRENLLYSNFLLDLCHGFGCSLISEITYLENHMDMKNDIEYVILLHVVEVLDKFNPSERILMN